MDFKSDIYPYVIGVVIIILTVFFGLGSIPFETFMAIIAALLGVGTAAAHASSRKQLKALGRAQGLK
jgi:uncharacterized membrane protein